MNCSVGQALEQLGDWWTLLIVRDAMRGVTRFQQFEKSLGIAKNVLTNRLAALVENEIFEKQRLEEPGLRYEYKLTPKGRDLWALLTAMRLWSDKWVFGDDKVPIQLCERDTGRQVARLVAVDSKGEPVDASKLEWVKGPGWKANNETLYSVPGVAEPRGGARRKSSGRSKRL